MKDVDISSMGELALTSHLKGKKHQTLTSQKRSSASIPDFFGISSQRPATKSDDAKVVSKSASSESGEHSKLNATKSIVSSSGSLVMENQQANASFPGYRPIQHAWGLMRRFIRTAVISEAKTPVKLTKLDPADSSIHVSFQD